MRRVGNDSADDVVSEVFVAAWRRRSEVPDAALPWLYKTARNVVLHNYRSDGRRAGLLAAVSAVGETTSPSAEDASTAVIDSVLDGLDSINAEVLRLTVWEALSPSEIAQVLAIEPGAARVRLLRARRRAQDLFLETHPIPAMQGESHA